MRDKGAEKYGRLADSPEPLRARLLRSVLRDGFPVWASHISNWPVTLFGLCVFTFAVVTYYFPVGDVGIAMDAFRFHCGSTGHLCFGHS